jgi:uncharacterized protein (TIGR00106 family)
MRKIAVERFWREPIMAILEISVSPRGGADVSLSKYVARALQALKDSGLKYETHAMGTIIEGGTAELFAVVQRMHEACFGDEIKRVVTSIKIDDRRDRPHTIEGKVASVTSKLK